MKRLAFLIFILLAVGLSAFECDNQECCVMPVCSENATLTGTWRLVAFENPVTGTSDTDPDPKGKGVIFNFKDDQKEGSIEGHTVVNTVGGGYTLGPDCSFKILVFGGSKVGEHGWSSKAWLPSNATGFYKVNENKLVIKLDNQEEQLVFSKL